MNRLNTAIVIVNWNGWEDTVRCVAACGHLKDFNGAVVIVDNGSTDDSFDKILSWCRGEFEVPSTSSYARIATLEERSTMQLSLVVSGEVAEVDTRVRQEGLVPRGVHIIRSDINQGFGGGNNVGLRIAMLDPDCQLFWFLNSDSIPEPEAFKVLESVCLSTTQPLVCGSALLNYDNPMTVQALGSEVKYLTLKTTHFLENAPVSALTAMEVAYPMGAPVGAAMMINRAYIDQFGLFDERMFLYYEELDLVSRLPCRQSFVCPQSRVYHKGGQSTEGGHSVVDRGTRADYEFLKSRTLLARKIGGAVALMSIVTMVLSLVRRVSVGRYDLARHVIPAFIDGWRSASVSCVQR